MKLIITLAGLFLSTFTTAATVNGFDVSAYGFVKASALYADKAIASYNNINLSAPTHAAPRTRSEDHISRGSFQTQQSRIGFNLKKTDDLTAKLEFDFIDFNKSSPTTQMNPRVRIMSVTHTWGNNKIIVGQDWDMFSPVTTFTFDYVGLYFMAGNTGFMRQQAQFIRNVGDWDFGAALGMAGNNPGVTDADLELAKAPTYALRASRRLLGGQTGVSAIYSRLKYETTNQTHHETYGLNAFYEKAYERVTVKSEGYYGQNMANIGTLAIGKGTNTKNVREFGVTLTANYKVIDRHFLFGGAGMAKVTNISEVTPFAMASNVVSSPGVLENIVAKMGWDYRVTEDLSWVTEISRMQTVSKLEDAQQVLSIAGIFETGIQLRF